jgi:hypothetical protein
MEMFIKVCVKYNIHPLYIFKFALEKIGKTVTLEHICDYFVLHCLCKEEGVYELIKIPEEVDNYCLDVLAKKIPAPTLPQDVMDNYEINEVTEYSEYAK